MLPAPPPTAPSAPPAAGPAGDPPGEPGRSWWTPRRTAVVLAGTAVAGCAYVALVDPNESSWYPQCPFKTMTGWDCPGCGITRAIRALVTGHPVRALDHNVLFVVALVVGMVWYATTWLRTRRGRPPLTLRGRRWWIGAAIAAVGAFWILRNVPWGPGRWLGAGASGA